MKINEIVDTIWWEYRMAKSMLIKYNIDLNDSGVKEILDEIYKDGYNAVIKEDFKDDELNKFIKKDFPKEIEVNDLDVSNYYIFMMAQMGPEKPFMIISAVELKDQIDVNKIKMLNRKKLSKPGSSYMYFKDIDGVKNFLFELGLTFAGTYDININWN